MLSTFTTAASALVAKAAVGAVALTFGTSGVVPTCPLPAAVERPVRNATTVVGTDLDPTGCRDQRRSRAPTPPSGGEQDPAPRDGADPAPAKEPGPKDPHPGRGDERSGRADDRSEDRRGPKDPHPGQGDERSAKAEEPDAPKEPHPGRGGRKG